MNVIESLHKGLKIMASDIYSGEDAPIAPPALEEDIADLLLTFPQAPLEYLDIIRSHDGLTFIERNLDIYRENVLLMTVLSAKEALFTMTQWHPFLIEQMPNCFFFARDGDDVYLYSEIEGERGIYRVGFAGAGWETAEYLGDSLASILVDGAGWASN